MAYRADKSEFEELVEQAIAELPEQFASALEEMSIQIEPRPTARQLQSVKIGSHHLLLGLYQGRPRTVRSVEDGMTLPDVIFLFQEPIEAISRSRQDLIQQVRKTVLHEIGHHFGLSEEDLSKLGYG